MTDAIRCRLCKDSGWFDAWEIAYERVMGRPRMTGHVWPHARFSMPCPHCVKGRAHIDAAGPNAIPARKLEQIFHVTKQAEKIKRRAFTKACNESGIDIADLEVAKNMTIAQLFAWAKRIEQPTGIFTDEAFEEQARIDREERKTA